MKNNLHVIVSYHKYYFDTEDDETFYELEKIIVLHNDNQIELPVTDSKFAYFKTVQKYVLDTLKANNIKLDYYIEFNAKWYNIYYVNTDLPFKLKKYSVPLN